jgi:hypothetical protein
LRRGRRLSQRRRRRWCGSGPAARRPASPRGIEHGPGRPRPPSRAQRPSRTGRHPLVDAGRFSVIGLQAVREAYEGRHTTPKWTDQEDPIRHDDHCAAGSTRTHLGMRPAPGPLRSGVPSSVQTTSISRSFVNARRRTRRLAEPSHDGPHRARYIPSGRINRSGATRALLPTRNGCCMSLLNSWGKPCPST